MLESGTQERIQMMNDIFKAHDELKAIQILDELHKAENVTVNEVEQIIKEVLLDG